MGVFSRYIFRQTAGALLLILLTLTGVVWIALALKQLNLMTTQGQEAMLFFKMTLLALPNLMAVIAPIALLVAAIHSLNRLNGDSELIVMTAAGATVWHFARPLLALALLVSIAVSLVNHFAMPWSLRQLHGYINQVRTDLISQVLRPGRFSAPERGVTIHIRERARDGLLLGIIMHDERKPKEMTSYLAESGRILKDSGGAFLMMKNGHILRKERGKPASIIVFDRFPIDLTRLDKKEAKFNLKPRERYFSELVNLDPKNAYDMKLRGKFRSELHERFASPLYPFAFVLIAIAFVGRAQTTRQSRIEALVLAFVCAAGARLAGLFATNVVTLSSAAVPLIYILPLGTIAIAAIFAQIKMRPRKRSKTAMRIRDTIEAIIGRLAAWRRQPPAGQGAASPQ